MNVLFHLRISTPDYFAFNNDALYFAQLKYYNDDADDNEGFVIKFVQVIKF